MESYVNKNNYQDHSNAQSNRWFAIIDGMPGVEFKIQKFNIPRMQIGSTDTMKEGETMVTFPGDTFYVDDLEIDFIIDENYHNFFYAYKWMRENTRNNNPDVRDVTVLMLNNEGKPQGVRFTYIDSFPISLSTPNLDSDGESHDMVANLVFNTNSVIMTIVGHDGEEIQYPPEDYASGRG